MGSGVRERERVCVCVCVCVCVYLMLRPCMMAKGPVEPRASWEVRQFLKSAHCTSESSLSAIRFLRGNTQCVIVCVCERGNTQCESVCVRESKREKERERGRETHTFGILTDLRQV